MSMRKQTIKHRTDRSSDRAWSLHREKRTTVSSETSEMYQLPSGRNGDQVLRRRESSFASIFHVVYYHFYQHFRKTARVTLFKLITRVRALASTRPYTQHAHPLVRTRNTERNTRQNRETSAQTPINFLK